MNPEIAVSCSVFYKVLLKECHHGLLKSVDSRKLMRGASFFLELTGLAINLGPDCRRTGASDKATSGSHEGAEPETQCTSYRDGFRRNTV